MAHTHSNIHHPHDQPATGPDRVLSAGRRVLARFGSKTLDHVPSDAFIDWTTLWAELRSDFTTPVLPEVPDLEDMSPAVRSAARAYIRQRFVSDVMLGRCEELHRDLYLRGISTDAVEAYAAARDAYEDSVEAFGAARKRLAGLMAPPPH